MCFILRKRQTDTKFITSSFSESKANLICTVKRLTLILWRKQKCKHTRRKLSHYVSMQTKSVMTLFCNGCIVSFHLAKPRFSPSVCHFYVSHSDIYDIMFNHRQEQHAKNSFEFKSAHSRRY